MAFTTITEVKIIDNVPNVVNMLLKQHRTLWAIVANKNTLITLCGQDCCE